MVSSVEIFDRKALRRKRMRCAKNFSAHNFLVEKVQSELSERLNDIKREFPLALEIGGFANGKAFPQIDKLVRMNLIKDNFLSIIADEEFLPFAANSFDLIISPLVLHSVNDLPGALAQLHNTLKPDGVFLAAIFGGETLRELRESLMQAEMKCKGGVSPRVFPFADKQQMGALMQRAGFALPVVDSEIITVTYESSFKLMHDLRGMGESNIIRERQKINPGKALFMECEAFYKDNFADPDGRLRASFEIIYLIGWAPHDSQQQPLRPGSAKTRLSDALSAEEVKI